MKSNKIFFIRNQIKKIKFNLRERIFSTKFLYLNLYSSSYKLYKLNLSRLLQKINPFLFIIYNNYFESKNIFNCHFLTRVFLIVFL